MSCFVWGVSVFCTSFIFRYGLEVYFVVVAFVVRYGACSYLEDIDGVGFEVLYGDRVGGVFYGCGVVFIEFLSGNREDS